MGFENNLFIKKAKRVKIANESSWRKNKLIYIIDLHTLKKTERTEKIWVKDVPKITVDQSPKRTNKQTLIYTQMYVFGEKYA